MDSRFIAEGVILHGKIIPEEEFKQAIRELLTVDDSIMYSLYNVAQLIMNNQIREAFSAWENFYTNILGNPTVQLLTILNFHNQHNSQTWRLVNEHEYLKSDGLINVSNAIHDINTEFISAENTQILAKHLGNLFQTLQKEETSKEERRWLYMNTQLYVQNSNIPSNIIKYMKSKNRQLQYAPIIYGENYRAGGYVAYRGKVADAFINHLGKEHPEIFVGQVHNLTADAFNKSVKVEEELHQRFNFLRMLLASLNTTGWWTGGDLIITNVNREVIANLQLKVSGNLGEQIGRIKTDKLLNKINQILEIYRSGTNDNLPDIFYDMLKTSAIVTELETAVGEAGIEIANEILQPALDISIHF